VQLVTASLPLSNITYVPTTSTSIKRAIFGSVEAAASAAANFILATPPNATSSYPLPIQRPSATTVADLDNILNQSQALDTYTLASLSRRRCGGPCELQHLQLTCVWPMCESNEVEIPGEVKVSQGLSRECAGVVEVDGAVTAAALVHRDDTIDQVCELLREDLKWTLAARCGELLIYTLDYSGFCSFLPSL
jgi:hypothetical protein